MVSRMENKHTEFEVKEKNWNINDAVKGRGNKDNINGKVVG